MQGVRSARAWPPRGEGGFASGDRERDCVIGIIMIIEGPENHIAKIRIGIVASACRLRLYPCGKGETTGQDGVQICECLAGCRAGYQ